jgi:tetraacyldisaccharide 4'-kinase
MRKLLLCFLSLIYGFITSVRNWLYDFRILKSVDFDIPVISIGNITVGGTGKTPHIEYLIRLLQSDFRVATLSRGYMRKTKGFRVVETTSGVEETGDEPLQIKKKFPEITVSVCENRVTGVQELLRLKTPPDVVLLDDAFQHRRINPGINIVLIDYNKPLNEDHMLPCGRLRENPAQLRRATSIIVTKCPSEVTPITRRIMAKDVYLFPYQELFFTSITYGSLYPVFPDAPPQEITDNLLKKGILVVSGIASPEYMINYLEQFSGEVKSAIFPDHHYYDRGDILRISQKFHELKSTEKIVVTTEKDVQRLTVDHLLTKELKSVLYCLPVQVKFLDQEGKQFDNKIKEYVGENKSNRALHFRKNAHKS